MADIRESKGARLTALVWLLKALRWLSRYYFLVLPLISFLFVYLLVVLISDAGWWEPLPILLPVTAALVILSWTAKRFAQKYQ